uniref:Rhodanese domain-containing protein n=1 Tax=Leptocylindrus danicus TaxID=163516 RepID=A0A7S2NWD5_9STRA
MGKESGVLSGRVLAWDAMNMKFSEVTIKRDESREKIAELIDYQGFCAGPKAVKKSAAETTATSINGRTMDEAETNTAEVGETSTYHTIEPTECLQKLASGWAPWVLDVRLHSENDITALPFTDKVSPHREVSLIDIPKEGDILLYCKAGARSKKAITRLLELGVDEDRLYNLDGGIMRWQKDVDPAMPRY